MEINRRSALRLLAGTAGACAAGGVFAQVPIRYPDHPVSLVIPFPAGGLADSVGRAVQPLLEAELGVPVVPINKPGASGAIGTAQVVGAKPDGHTVLFTLSSITVLPEQARVNGQKEAFQLKQLQAVARFSVESFVLVVPADSRYQTARQLIDDAQRRPGQVSYASSGNYGTVHLPVEVFAAAVNARFNHIPFSGGAPALQNLLGSHVDFSFLPRSVVASYLKSKQLRALASVSSQRWAQLPDLPLLSEMGVDMAFYPPWTGMFLPAGCPEIVVARLRAASAKIAANPAFRATIEGAEAQVAYLDAPEFERYWTQEAEKLNDVVRRIGKLG